MSGAAATVAAKSEPAPALAGTGEENQRRTGAFLNRGGAEGGRTPDLRIANATLSQLSYGPETRFKRGRIMGAGSGRCQACAGPGSRSGCALAQCSMRR
ncbi:hypothetical protein DF3PA_10146 [Candidatus Defluviicoccus seviourii]|uniref:Uncharacterized protein n=2 Tax=root TaxID=1 RepID=A0A564W981_9PROT|nr:hypothetical protein DF3PB_190019 [uncultured Defluviicoccus sp.]VUX45021.1 hypothetical protein DF3PA_10146 [Candidatus Defluviicoccus seviourii]